MPVPHAKSWLAGVANLRGSLCAVVDLASFLGLRERRPADRAEQFRLVGFNAKLALQYRGRLDASRKEAVADARRDLFEAMRQIARSGEGPREQVPSIGCSIKWRQTA